MVEEISMEQLCLADLNEAIEQNFTKSFSKEFGHNPSETRK